LNSEVAGTLPSVARFLESIKNQVPAFDPAFGQGEHVAFCNVDAPENGWPQPVQVP
jgi:hypothetical protein